MPVHRPLTSCCACRCAWMAAALRSASSPRMGVRLRLVMLRRLAHCASSCPLSMLPPSGGLGCGGSQRMGGADWRSDLTVSIGHVAASFGRCDRETWRGKATRDSVEIRCTVDTILLARLVDYTYDQPSCQLSTQPPPHMIHCTVSLSSHTQITSVSRPSTSPAPPQVHTTGPRRHLRTTRRLLRVPRRETRLAGVSSPAPPLQATHVAWG